jgi:hypothetical protein
LVLEGKETKDEGMKRKESGNSVAGRERLGKVKKGGVTI